MEEKKGLKILTARNGIALVAVLAILLILTLLIPVMFSMGTSSVSSTISSAKRQKAYYLSRSGVEMGVAYIKDMIYSYENVLDTVGRNKDTYEIEYDKLKSETSTLKLLEEAFPIEEEREEKIENTKFIEEFKKLYPKGTSNQAAQLLKDCEFIDTTKDTAYGITREEKDNGCQVANASMVRMWYYLDPNNNSNYKYVTSNDEQPSEIVVNNITYKLIGYFDVNVKYSGDPTYYDADGNETDFNGAYKYNSAKSLWELRSNCKRVQNDVFTVESTAHLASTNVTSVTSAAVVQTKEIGDYGSGEGIVQYTGNTYGESPDFYLTMNGLHRGDLIGNIYDSKHVLVVSSKTTDNGGNLCMADPTEADAKQEIKIESGGGTTEYLTRDIFIYSAIGNMSINCKGTGNETGDLVLGTYPGIAWKKANNPSCNVLDALNYYSWSDDVQYENFVAFCSSNVLDVGLGIDVRVNPTRAGRAGDVNLLGSSANASLFKMVALQGRDIVIDGRVDMMFSFFNPQGKNYYLSGQTGTNNTGKRAGTVVLQAPNNTPYSYFNETRKKQVSAGIVYFQSDVYLWVIPYNEDGSSSGYTKLSETVYKTATVTPNSFSKSTYSAKSTNNVTYTYTVVKTKAGNFEVYRLFKAGDVYYFNTDVMKMDGDETQTVGIDLTSWYLETNYLKRKSDGTLSTFFKNLRQNVYRSLITAFSDTDTYSYDDMHRIGNIEDMPAYDVPSTENEVFVVWGA